MHPHGSYSIEIDNNVIICRLRGSWNKEQALAFQHELQHNVNQINDIKWIYLVDASEFEGATPQAYQVQDLTIQWCVTNNLSKRIIISDNSMTVAIARKFQSNFQTIDTEVVASFEQAKALLNSEQITERCIV